MSNDKLATEIREALGLQEYWQDKLTAVLERSVVSWDAKAVTEKVCHVLEAFGEEYKLPLGGRQAIRGVLEQVPVLLTLDPRIPELLRRLRRLEEILTLPGEP